MDALGGRTDFRHGLTQEEERSIVRTYWGRAGVLALVATLAACDDNPVDEGRGEASSLVLNPAFAVVNAADTTRVNGFARDRYGEMTRDRVQFSACDNKITVRRDPTRVRLEPPDRVLVLAQTLGESCVVVSGPGNLRDTATIQVVPASIDVSLPATVGSGASAQADVTFLDGNGDPASGFGLSEVVFSVSDPAIASVDEMGAVFGKAPGSAELIVTLVSTWSADRAGTAAFTVEPGQFMGTASAASGNSGDQVTYTAGPNQEPWDGDTEVLVGGVRSFILSGSSATDLVTKIPYGLQPGTEVLFQSVGQSQVALVTDFDVQALITTDNREPNDGPGSADPVTLPFDDVLVVDNVDIDDFFAFSLSQETTLNLLLDWDADVNEDMDLLVRDAADTAFQCGFATASTAIPESGSCTLPAGDYLLWVNNFSEAGTTNYRIFVEVAP